MKLRRIPEDFKVYEVNDFIINEKGGYRLYYLEKKGIEIFELIEYLSRKNKIPYENFGIAGLKDRHAITSQYLTIQRKYVIRTLKENNFNIKFIGFVDKPIKIGDLKGNRFEITVRDITKSEIQGIFQKSNELIIPNYFDSQRFGSVINNQFIAKYLIKRKYELAVKTYLTAYSRHEPKRIKDEKRALFKNWGKPVKLKTRRLAAIIKTYNTTKDWLKAYQKIPRNIREIIVSAYQSYLWNECVKLLLRTNMDKRNLYDVDYNVGKLTFFRKMKAEIQDTFPTISNDMKIQKDEKEIIDKILTKEGLTLNDLNIKETGNFFRSYERKVLLTPIDFKMSQTENDELSKNRFKLKLEFTLPKGSYATIVTKRLIGK